MKSKIKLILCGLFLGVAGAAKPHDAFSITIAGVALLMGIDGWIATVPRPKTHEEWRAEVLSKRLP